LYVYKCPRKQPNEEETWAEDLKNRSSTFQRQRERETGCPYRSSSKTGQKRLIIVNVK
jgi:hypothetical protein